MESTRFEVRFRNQEGRVCRFAWNCDEFTPEECEVFIQDIAIEGNKILSAETVSGA